MYSSSSSSMDMEEGMAFVSPAPAVSVAAEESPTRSAALPAVARSPLHNQQEAATTAMAGRDQDSTCTDHQQGADTAHTVAKGKRTKRPRTAPTPSAAHQQPTPASSASNSCFSGGSGAVTEEEEDMANCLILLAQGDPNGAAVIKNEERSAAGNGRATSRRFAETSSVAASSGCASAKAGFYVYECKTCSRCFTTFQALGGHRASHKKPKVESCYGVSGHDVLVESEEKTRPLEQVLVDHRPHQQQGQEQRPAMLESQIAPLMTAPPLSTAAASSMILQNNNNNSSSNAAVMNNNTNIITNNNKSTTARIHECSICGSEFQSGQALGGHMRRHRAAASAAAATPATPAPPASPPSQLSQVLLHPTKKPEPVVVPPTKSVVLPLDLNLPAPSDDTDFTKASQPPAFPFSVPSKRPPMLFSASPLVGCHY